MTSQTGRLVSSIEWTVVALLLLSVPSVAMAQEPASPSDAQLELYEEGAAAFRAEEYNKAIRIFRTSLDLGELNIIYLNLGRALYKNGQCREANVAYDKVEGAPTVSSPPPDAVLVKLAEYRADLDTCPGDVTVTCVDDASVITVGGETVERACGGDPLSLPPGEHELVATLGEERQTQKITVTAMGEHTVSFSLEAPTEKPIAPPPVTQSPRGTSTLAIVGWVTIGTGGAILAASGAYDLFVLTEDLDRYEMALRDNDPTADQLRSDLDSGQTLVRFGLGLGAAAVLTGVALVVFAPDGSESASAEGASFWVAPGVAGDGPSIVGGARF